MPEFFDGPKEAHNPGFEPVVPCRQFELRPCVVLTTDPGSRFRTEECAPGECVRYPNRDLRELQAQQQEDG